MPDTGQVSPLSVINSFTTDPNTITPGGSAMISWNVSNATSISIDHNIGNVSLTGSTHVSPNTTTTYTLTASNASGSTTATTQVVVASIPQSPTLGSPPIVNAFTASPSSISAGNFTTLSWDVSNATSVNISPAVGAVALSGSTSISPDETTSYTLKASNAAGSTFATVQVVVSPAASSPSSTSLPTIHWFSASPETIVEGESSTLSWNVSNASSISITSAKWTQVAIPSTGSGLISPSVTMTYTLTATNSAGTSSDTVTITVTPRPATSQSLGWTGTWQTNWGIMHLSQSTGQVTGTYEHDNGKIIGYISKNVTGNILIGTWSEAPSYAPPDDAGDIEWVMAPDFNSFSGKWRYGSSGEWDGTWTGTRITP